MAVLQPPGAPPPFIDPMEAMTGGGLPPGPEVTGVAGVGVPEGPPDQMFAEGPPIPGTGMEGLGEPPPQFPPSHWFADAAPGVWGQDEGAPPVPEATPADLRGEVPPLSEEEMASKNGPPEVGAQAAADNAAAAKAQADKEEADYQKLDPYQQAQVDLKRNEAAQLEAQRQMDEATKAKNARLADEGVRMAEDYDKKVSAANVAYEQANKEADEKRATLEQEAIDIANTKVDPKHAFRDMSIGAKITMMIAAGLQGATTQALKGGKNTILDIMDKMIERDMEAQQLDLANRTTMLGQRRGMLADEIAQGRDLLDFRYKSALTAYNIADNKVKAMILHYDNDVITAQGNALRAQIQGKTNELGTGYKLARREDYYKRAQDAAQNRRADQALQLQREGLEEEKRKNAAAEKAAAAQGPDVGMLNYDLKKEQDRRERMIEATTKDGQQIYTKDKEAATKAAEKMAAAQNGAAAIVELQEIYDKHGWQPMGEWSGGEEGEDYQRARTLTQTVMTSFSQEKGQGTIRDSEYDMYLKMIGKPGGLVDPTHGSLAAMHELFVNDVNDVLGTMPLMDENGKKVKAQHWRPATRLKRPDPKKDAAGNPQGMERDEVLYIEDRGPNKGKPNKKGSGRAATPAEEEAYVNAGGELAKDIEPGKAAHLKPGQSQAEWEGIQKRNFEVRRQANIQAVRKNPRIELRDLPFPTIGLSGVWNGGAVK